MLDEQAVFPAKILLAGILAGDIINASGMCTNHAQQRPLFQDGEHEFRAVFGPGLIEFAIV